MSFMPEAASPGTDGQGSSAEGKQRRSISSSEEEKEEKKKKRCLLASSSLFLAAGSTTTARQWDQQLASKNLYSLTHTHTLLCCFVSDLE
jgi:hypothetical protein